jgi:hypothetical protein
MREKVAEMRAQLLQALGGQFEGEITRSLSNINDTIAPYTRFVRAETDKLTQAQGEIENYQTELRRLKANIESD